MIYEEDLVVIVPVLDRPQNVAPLCASFSLSNTPGRLMFVVTRGDDAELAAVEASGENYVLTEKVTWPDKINLAYRMIHNNHLAEWVLFGADDVRFYEGWWDATSPFRAQPEICVIGTNDLGNPRVTAGDHTTHPLVRASYMGTIDDPDSVVHGGYAHSFVDDEFLWTAKMRQAWAFAPTAIIEHYHPFWNKSEWDATYEKGQATLEADKALWFARAPLLGLQVVQ